ncbi:monovalent cation/H+ antiporter subunit E [Halovenus salina]|uniref:Monovalent cation/H+ antiporter subunit E n=1 Tax=Halovenus salina TaxID=1510225 RepID=A0ABD5VZE4_9EURY|nr:monovalent cation/H+ antiporter subunit E [Halovenus salina]
MSDSRLLVPVATSSTLRQTVEYAVRTALDSDGDGYVRFVYVHSPEVSDDRLSDETETDVETITGLLDRITVWAEEDTGDHTGELTVETDQIGADRYLFSPSDVGAALAEAAAENDIDRVVLDPEYDPGIGSPLLRPLEVELTRLTDVPVEEAPVQRQVRRRPLVLRSTPLQAGTLAFVSFVFYQILGGTFTAFDLVTGAVSATIVGVSLARITFTHNPSTTSLRRLLRMVVYVPYLFAEILKANIQVAAVILDPRLPIEPRLTRVNAAVWGSVPVTTLANSITLTPGTLTVRVEGRTLTVHTLVPGPREGLFDGGLESAVRFVFYGRSAMNMPSPRERGDTEILQSPDDETATADTVETDGGEQQ